MSAKSSPSPPQGPSGEVDESQLPQGHCRYILLVPEIRGQRCACANFRLNRSLPGATCDCGHLACYHNKEAEPPETDLLKRRIQALEDRLADWDKHSEKQADDAYIGVLARVSGVEEELERSRDEFHQEIKHAYSNTTPLWNAYQQLKLNNRALEEQLRVANSHFARIDTTLRRLDDRQLELQDADAYLEERIENIVGSTGEAGQSRTRTASPIYHPGSPIGSPDGASVTGSGRPRPPAVFRQTQDPGDAWSSAAAPLSLDSIPIRSRPASAATSGTWIVHISLMPRATAPMPFERNTNAYQRCLSRGLHRTVAVRGPTADAFNAAVSNAFGALLKGRPWAPLQAKLCEAAPLQGLPMLRRLEPSLLRPGYDAVFLRDYCAVCDSNGAIDSLYIAMCDPHMLSWHTLRHSPVVVEGLEDSWGYDPLLDREPCDEDVIADNGDVRQPAVEDMLTSFSSLKRSASFMARSNSGSSGLAPDSLSSRTKRACSRPANSVVSMRQPGVGTA